MSSLRPSTLALLLLLVPGCIGDPAEISVSGKVLIASSIDAGRWASIQLRGCAADAGVGPTCIGSTGAPMQRGAVEADGGSYRIDFVGSSSALTPVKDWKVVAWASAEADAGDAPAPGEWWGTTVVELSASSPPYNGSYGGVAHGDVTIDQRAP